VTCYFIDFYFILLNVFKIRSSFIEFPICKDFSLLSLYCSRGLSWVHMCECGHTLTHSTANKGDVHDYKLIIEIRCFNI